MPNTKSAARRARNSARKQANNRAVKTRLKTLHKAYAAVLKEDNKKEDATKAYRALASALDKAAKRGVIHRRTADRKKSRLSVKLNPKPAA